MAWTSRTTWTDDRIAEGIRDVMSKLGISHMPSARQIRSVTDSHALAAQVSKRAGGFDGWADRLGVPRAAHASRLGWEWEAWFMDQARQRGFHVQERTRVKEPYDCIVNGRTVDVKVANGAWITDDWQWTWRIGKKAHTTEFYALVALTEGRPSVLILPAEEVPLTCMSMRGGSTSQRSRAQWFDRWDLFGSPSNKAITPMTPIFLDIETLKQAPETFMVPDVATMAPPKTHKKAETIAEWRKEKAETLLDELRDQSSLEPLMGGIVVAVGVAIGNEPAKCIVAKTFDEAGELALLTAVEKAFAKYLVNPIVTWNGSGFDYAFLGKRALRHGLYSLARVMHRDKPWSPLHIDCLDVWRQHNRQSLGKLVDVARFLGIPDPHDPITGADVTEAIQAGRAEDVKAHCLADIVRLREVYWRLRAGGWIVIDDEVPDELPVRPPRVSERDALLAACAELQVGLDLGTVLEAARDAGVPVQQAGDPADGPHPDGCTLDVLRRYHAALQGQAERRFRADVVDGVGVADGAEGVGVGASAAGAHASAENGQAA